MTDHPTIDVAALTAIDVHTHLEPPRGPSDTDAAAQKYFGAGSVARDGASMAEYYRSRKMAFVVFAVDERLTGRPASPTTKSWSLRRANADVAIPFISVNPTRGRGRSR